MPFAPTSPSVLRTALESVCGHNGADAWTEDAPNLWDTSAIDSFFEMFKDLTSCNPNIANWDTSSVKSMKNMFKGATIFNSDIGDWNTEAVEDMSGMFDTAINFDQPIGKWRTGEVKTMSHMFSDAHKFNQRIGEWDVSKVTYMNNMFRTARKFDQDLLFWDVSSVITIDSIFSMATQFDGDISTWKTHNMQSSKNMLGGGYGAPDITFTTRFNKKKLITWDTSSMTDQLITNLGPAALRGVEDINCPGDQRSGWTPRHGTYFHRGDINVRCASEGIYTPMNLTCDNSACNYPNGICLFYDYVANKGIPLNPDTWSTGSWSYGKATSYPVRCACKTDYNGDQCENAPYNWNNVDNEAACQSVHSSPGCGGLFLCNDAPTPCPDLGGPRVNGAQVSLDFTVALQQELTVQAGVANAFYRPYGSPTNSDMSYVAKVIVPSGSLQNFAVMSLDSNTCEDVKLVYGTPDGKAATVIGFSSSGVEGAFTGCDALLNGALSITQLSDTSKIWLMVKKRKDGNGNQIGLGVKYTVTYTNNNPVIPADDRVFYRFSLASMTVTNSTIGSVITLRVDPISHDGDDDFTLADCQSDIAQLLSTISTQKGGSCSLALASQSTTNTPKTLTYVMPRDKYASCANDVIVAAEQPVVYQGRIVLNTIQQSVVSPGKECHFFQPQDDGRNYQISMTRDLVSREDLTTTSQIANLHSSITNVQAQACPGERILKAKLVFDLRVEYSGTKEGDMLTSGTLKHFDLTGSNVALQNPNDPLNGCFPNGGTNGGGVCRYRLVSDECEFLYRTKTDKCIFGDTKFVTYHANFKESAGSGHSVTHKLAVPTKQYLKEFAGSLCVKQSETASTIDVTDDYKVTLAVRNHNKAGIEWDSVSLASKKLVWNKPIAARLSVADLYNKTEVQIKSVKFELKNEITNTVIQTRTATRAMKKVFMASSKSRYYEDPHFCRDFNKDFSGPNKCYPFYKSDDATRWNNYMGNFSPAELYHCTKSLGSAHEHDSDYVTFDLSKWNTKPDVPHISVTATVVAAIEACEPGTYRRRSLNSDAVEKIIIVSTKIEIKDDAATILGRRFGSNATPTRPQFTLAVAVAFGFAAMTM